MSAFIKQSKTAELMVNPAFQVYAPQFIGDELLKYREEIAQRTHRSIESFNLIIAEIFSLMTFPSYDEVKSHIQHAAQISPDPKDISYLAVALYLNCPIWSNDSALREKQNIVRVYTTHELARELQDSS